MNNKTYRARPIRLWTKYDRKNKFISTLRLFFYENSDNCIEIFSDDRSLKCNPLPHGPAIVLIGIEIDPEGEDDEWGKRKIRSSPVRYHRYLAGLCHKSPINKMGWKLYFMVGIIYPKYNIELLFQKNI